MNIELCAFNRRAELFPLVCGTVISCQSVGSLAWSACPVARIRWIGRVRRIVSRSRGAAAWPRARGSPRPWRALGHRGRRRRGAVTAELEHAERAGRRDPGRRPVVGRASRCSRRARARSASPPRRCRQARAAQAQAVAYPLRRRPPRRSSPTTTQTSQPPSTDSGGLTPQPTAQNETPTGENQKAWSEAILTSPRRPADQREHRVDRLLDAERGGQPAQRHRRRQQPHQRKPALLRRGADPGRRRRRHLPAVLPDASPTASRRSRST